MLTIKQSPLPLDLPADLYLSHFPLDGPIQLSWNSAHLAGPWKCGQASSNPSGDWTCPCTLLTYWLEFILRSVSAQVLNSFMVPPTWLHPTTEETHRYWFQSKLVSISTHFLRFYYLDLGLSPSESIVPKPWPLWVNDHMSVSSFRVLHVSNDPSRYSGENSVALDHILPYN